MATLYERLGGTESITKIASDLVDLHLRNPRIAPRFEASDVSVLKNAAATFFIAGSGGPNVYKGKDMLSAHRGINIDNSEFTAVLDDALEALDPNNVGQREKEDVLYILYSIGKKDIVRVQRFPTAIGARLGPEESAEGTQLGANAKLAAPGFLPVWIASPCFLWKSSPTESLFNGYAGRGPATPTIDGVDAFAST